MMVAGQRGHLCGGQLGDPVAVGSDSQRQEICWQLRKRRRRLKLKSLLAFELVLLSRWKSYQESCHYWTTVKQSALTKAVAAQVAVAAVALAIVFTKLTTGGAAMG